MNQSAFHETRKIQQTKIHSRSIDKIMIQIWGYSTIALHFMRNRREHKLTISVTISGCIENHPQNYLNSQCVFTRFTNITSFSTGVLLDLDIIYKRYWVINAIMVNKIIHVVYGCLDQHFN